MKDFKKIVDAIEEHSVDGIRECFNAGVSPNDRYNNKPLIDELTSEYLRSPQFKDCVRVFVDYGLEFGNDLLLAVLLNDERSLEQQLKKELGAIDKRFTLRCAFTPLYQVTLLHVCAEFNHVACAEVLVANGSDVNAKAGVDAYGFGGQTPVFHTVNQIRDNSREMLTFLLSQGVDLHCTVKGLVWGEGYEWETLIPAVNPISYAMMGLLPQMHRNEQTISDTVSMLMKTAYGIDYVPANIPNKYLTK